MFSRRKKNYNIFLYTALILTICALLAVLLWPEPVAVSENNENINVNSQANTIDKTENQEETYEKEEVTEPVTNSYYIVKKNGNVISVYFVSEDGTKVKLEDTEILYELLPLEDQNKFDTGIIIENQEKLMTLLQDYES